MTTKQPVWSWTDAVAQAGVQPLTKLVCLNIARHLSSSGKGWRISIREMMAETGLGERALGIHLKKAADAKLIVIKREYNHLGHRAITQYVPRFPDGTELAKEPASLPAPDAARPTPSLTARRAARLPARRAPRPTAPRAAQVSSLDQSSQRGGLSAASEQVAASAETSFQTTDKIDLGEAGETLIPFSSTSGRRPKDLIEEARTAAAAAQSKIGKPTDWLPFTKHVIGQIRMWCLDPEAMIARYKAHVAKGNKVRDPNAYLITIAAREVAKRDGITVADVMAMASKDQGKRVAAMVAAVEPDVPIGPVKLARASSELVAQLGKSRRA